MKVFTSILAFIGVFFIILVFWGFLVGKDGGR